MAQVETFLEEVARSLYERYGDDISSLSLFLPSKRARLFFAESLSRQLVRPIWEPNYSSVDDIMSSLSGLRQCDRLRLVAELYKIYSRFHNEKFDNFYHWGELMLADFDMIDKYCIDAEQLFANINDLKELEADISYLTPEQRHMIHRFWGVLAGEVSEDSAKGKFLSLWRSLGDIYRLYKERLQELGIGYTGMIYRDAVERLERGDVAIDKTHKYIFIGFNALSECEKRLFVAIDRLGLAEFYWDRDDYYTAEDSRQEAGMFIRQNMALLSSVDGISHNNFRNIGSVNVISTATAIAQCQYVVTILKKIASQSKDGVLGKDTVVVLTDENLLMPLLYALPAEMKSQRVVNEHGVEQEKSLINVTMGYPLRTTLAYSLVDRLLELQKHAHSSSDDLTFYYADVDGLLSHPYISGARGEKYAVIQRTIVRDKFYRVPQTMLSEDAVLQGVFRKVEGWRELLDYLMEVVDMLSTSDGEEAEGASRIDYLAVAYESIAKLRNVMESCDMEGVGDATVRSLVRKHLQVERIPFTGEPLEGLQIMGILETRNLDFKNVIILSMTDNNFPGNRASEQSLIPYGLRCGFSLPTAEHHEGVYAYYFYRLIERAENLYMLYSTQSDDKSSAEPSRYIRQLEYETDIKIDYVNVGVEVKLAPVQPLEIVKSDAVMEKMMRFTDKGETPLSPTSFSRYVHCPLKFYFGSVERLKVDAELDESVDGATFGNIFHAAAEYLYGEVVGEPNPMAHIKTMVEQGAIETAVDKALAQMYFKREDGVLPPLSGELLIIRNIILAYLGNNVIGYDSRNPDFVVDKNESAVRQNVDIKVDDTDFCVCLEGRADRIDSLGEGLMRVIDYKTGSEKLEYAGIDKLFGGNYAQRISNIINTLLYAMMLSHERGCDVRPELYYVAKMANKEYSPLFVEKRDKQSTTLTSYALCREEFESKVKDTLCEMFDRKIPFRQCEDTNTCTYCDFKSICGR